MKKRCFLCAAPRKFWRYGGEKTAHSPADKSEEWRNRFALDRKQKERRTKKEKCRCARRFFAAVQAAPGRCGCTFPNTARLAIICKKRKEKTRWRLQSGPREGTGCKVGDENKEKPRRSADLRGFCWCRSPGLNRYGIATEGF